MKAKLSSVQGLEGLLDRLGRRMRLADGYKLCLNVRGCYIAVVVTLLPVSITCK